MRVYPKQLDQLLNPVLDPKQIKTLTQLAKGLPASPGAAVGTIVFSAEDAVEMSVKAPVILVRKETVPDDIHGMEVSKGILTARGGMTSHAAVVCRGMGTPCVAGAETVTVNEHKKEVSVTVNGKVMTLKEGDWLSLDGSTGIVYAGKANTLEAPLHEFLPKREDLMVDVAILPYADIKMKKELAAKYVKFGAEVKNLKTIIPELLKRVEELHEFNPMLGHRGCRLGVTYPEITEMQARAIFEAAVQVSKKGVKVIPEVMIPLIGSVQELEHQKKIVVAVAKEVLAKAGSDMKYMVGTMIEIPRAAL